MPLTSEVESTSHSMFTKVVTWINWLALAVLGAYSFIVSLEYFSDPTRCVLTVYLSLFGCLGAANEFKLTIATRNFGFLNDRKSKAMFLVFVGTLGLSFGWYNSPLQKIIPFVLGVFSCFTAVVVLVDGNCKKEGSSSGGAAAGGTEMKGGNAYAGPNAI